MAAPDDFGLTPLATLAHVGDTAHAPLHKPFWSRWREALRAAAPTLAPAQDQDPADPTATHQLESLRAVRIGARLIRPPRAASITGGLVTLHGYNRPPPLAEEDHKWKSLAQRGVAVLAVRVRGYPASTLDTGNWDADPEAQGWITHAFPAGEPTPEDALKWSLPLAVADAACAAIALARWLRARAPRDAHPTPPIALHGESFGAGLAVIAAAQTPHELARIDRLAIALPALGDWAWRAEDPTARLARGSGAHIRARLEPLTPQARSRALETLRLCDAAVHAREVQTPTLCKLARLDDTVPAPAAAALYNALAADPGRKWRFLVPEGHTAPSVACARRHALFRQCLLDFLDPARDPADAMAPWEPILDAGDRAPNPHAAPLTGAQPPLFADANTHDRADEPLIAAYQRAGRTLDDLPYTPQWAALYAEAGPATGMHQREAFHRLHNLRKAGRLPRLGRAAGPPPRITPEEEADLAAHVTRLVGSLGQRDRLPFTPEFDTLVQNFNARTGRDLSPHDLWRIIAKLAK